MLPDVRFSSESFCVQADEECLRLFIVKELAQKMDANVWVQVQGEKFCVSLNFLDARTL